MFELEFQVEKEFWDVLEKYPSNTCSKCKGLVEISMEHLNVKIENKEIDFEEIPLLKCTNCSNVLLTYYAQTMLSDYYNELLKRNKVAVKISFNENYRKYNYASRCDYIYDHRDYYSIPCLNLDYESGEEGFLTPVYFKKKALVYFVGVPEYDVDIFSKSYGIISKKSNNPKFKYEWDAPFGFNTKGKLIFWLGDLDSMDEETQDILRSFNLESDHLLIDSEFYQAQLNCIFSEPIPEQQIIISKNLFIANIKKRFEIDISHLEEECVKEAESISSPLLFTETYIKVIIQSLDKVLVEGFSAKRLRELYLKLCPKYNIDEDYKKWKSIKLLEQVLFFLANESNVTIDVDKTMSALYLLNDYRICLSHLLSEQSLNEKTSHIANVLGVDDFNKQEDIYLKEIAGLNTLFKQLSMLS